MPCYPDALALERAFLQGPGLRRFFGNHDLDWRDPAKVREHLEGPLPGVRVEEAVRLRVKDGGEELGVLFFVHGHQGTDLSDRGAGISRLALRYVWRAVQRSQGWLSTTPASNFALRHKHDLAMFHWAQARARRARRDRVLLIAGHTHHPVFPGSPPPWPDPAAVTAAREALERAREAGAPADEIARLRGEGERVAAMLRPPRFATPPDDPPCYFNTGCCCFPDGDVTCLEITGGELRLVRWLDDEGRAVAKVLAPPRSLREVLGAISAAA